MRLIISSILCLLFTCLLSCGEEGVEVKSNKNFYKVWKEETEKAIRRCCNQDNSIELILDSSKDVFRRREVLLDTLLTKVHLKLTNKFIVEEYVSLSSNAIMQRMHVYTKEKTFQADIFSGGEIKLLELEYIEGVELDSQDNCCSKPYSEYYRYYGFTRMGYRTLFNRFDDGYKIKILVNVD